MAISGHKTRSVFDRYNIVDEKDLTEAMMKTERYMETVKEPRKVVSMKPKRLVKSGRPAPVKRKTRRDSESPHIREYRPK